jgi:hypothetical protein
VDETGTHGGVCRHTFTLTAREGDIRELRSQLCVADLDPQGLPRRGPECLRYTVIVIGPPGVAARPATCASPAVNVTTWNATGSPVLAQSTCTCSIDGTVIPFTGAAQGAVPGSFTQQCFAAGGFTATWSGGVCGCSEQR